MVLLFPAKIAIKWVFLALPKPWRPLKASKGLKKATIWPQKPAESTLRSSMGTLVLHTPTSRPQKSVIASKLKQKIELQKDAQHPKEFNASDFGLRE